MTRYPVAPAKCRCGRRPKMFTYPLGDTQVECRCGWRGPWRKTQRGAITAWNYVMARFDGRAR